MIESDAITRLNPESALADTAWIHAGKVAWDWWSGSPAGKHAFTTATMKYYVDFAATSGFECMLVDTGWPAGRDITRMNGRVDIPEMARYAAAQEVRVWIWIAYDEAVAIRPFQPMAIEGHGAAVIRCSHCRCSRRSRFSSASTPAASAQLNSVSAGSG